MLNLTFANNKSLISKGFFCQVICIDYCTSAVLQTVIKIDEISKYNYLLYLLG